MADTRSIEHGMRMSLLIARAASARRREPVRRAAELAAVVMLCDARRRRDLAALEIQHIQDTLQELES